MIYNPQIKGYGCWHGHKLAFTSPLDFFGCFGHLLWWYDIKILEYSLWYTVSSIHLENIWNILNMNILHWIGWLFYWLTFVHDLCIGEPGNELNSEINKGFCCSVHFLGRCIHDWSFLNKTLHVIEPVIFSASVYIYVLLMHVILGWRLRSAIRIDIYMLFGHKDARKHHFSVSH